jgi:hypothetical protein
MEKKYALKSKSLFRELKRPGFYFSFTDIAVNIKILKAES